MLLKALLIDDEQMGREVLANYLKLYCHEKLEVVGMVNNITSAKNAIEELQPDIVFLDIEMPHGSGFDLLQQIEVINFDIIFVTAYNQYAIKALNEIDPAYYLLKPIEITALENAVNKVFSKHEKRKPEYNSTNNKATSKGIENLRLPVKDGIRIVKIDDIIRCEGDGNYTYFFIKEMAKKLTICKTLKYYTTLLKAHGFVRVNKSSLVNVTFIKEYKKSDGGYIILSTGNQLSVTTRYKDNFLAGFHKESIG